MPGGWGGRLGVGTGEGPDLSAEKNEAVEMGVGLLDGGADLGSPVALPDVGLLGEWGRCAGGLSASGQQNGETDEGTHGF